MLRNSIELLTYQAVILLIFGLTQVISVFSDTLLEDVVMPDGRRILAPSKDLSMALMKRSYVLDGKRFVERVDSRCGIKLSQVNLDHMEPEFVIARAEGDIRLSAFVEPTRILETGYNPTRKTTILVHGYTGGYPSTQWLRKTREVFQRYNLLDSYNLVIIDFEKAAQGKYELVAARSGLLGSYLANFIMKLILLGADPKSMHLIGHSLGAHVAAFAAKRFQGQIGRLSSLDPAGPCYKAEKLNHPEDRLTLHDALQVDNYHYDDLYLGLPGKLGTNDIYFNGGSNQPGCKENLETLFRFARGVILGQRTELDIGHALPIQLISLGLKNETCQFVAYECPDYSDFLAGLCDKCGPNNEHCMRVGFDFQYGEDGPAELELSPNRRELHIASDSFSSGPCLNHYSVRVTFDPTDSMQLEAAKESWLLEIELTSPEDMTTSVVLTYQEENHFSGLLLARHEPRKFVLARMQVRDKNGRQISIHRSTIKLGLSHGVVRLEVNFMSSISAKVREQFSSTLCPGIDKLSEVVRSARHGEVEKAIKPQESFSGSRFLKTDGWLNFGLCDTAR